MDRTDLRAVVEKAIKANTAMAADALATIQLGSDKDRLSSRVCRSPARIEGVPFSNPILVGPRDARAAQVLRLRPAARGILAGDDWDKARGGDGRQGGGRRGRRRRVRMTIPSRTTTRSRSSRPISTTTSSMPFAIGARSSSAARSWSTVRSQVPVSWRGRDGDDGMVRHQGDQGSQAEARRSRSLLDERIIPAFAAASIRPPNERARNSSSFFPKDDDGSGTELHHVALLTLKRPAEHISALRASQLGRDDQVEERVILIDYPQGKYRGIGIGMFRKLRGPDESLGRYRAVRRRLVRRRLLNTRSSWPASTRSGCRK